MKTIEERADTIADRYVDELHQKIARSSAIESATEQKRDDIEKACEWLTNLFDRDDYGLGVHTEKVVSRFRKAMEE